MAEQLEPSAGSADPFDEFNRHQGLGRVRDPYRRWAAMRRESPVQRMHSGEQFLHFKRFDQIVVCA